MDDLLPIVLRTAHTLSIYSTQMTSQVLSIVPPLRNYLSSNPAPDLTTIALLLVIAYLSLAIVGMATRWVYAMVVTVVRLAMLAAVVALVVWCWTAGVGEVAGELADAVDRIRSEIEKGGREGWTQQQGGKAGGGGGWY